MNLHYFLSVALVATGTLFAGTQTVWETNYQVALEKSAKEGKPLLLFFNGSDWSGWSMKMKKEMLDTQAFLEKIHNRVICVEVDFPIHQELSPELAKQNEELKEKWEISEYPRLVVADPSGRQIARYGYPDEPAEKFAEDLLSVLARDAQLSLSLAQLDSKKFSPEELESFYHLAVELQRYSDSRRVLEYGLNSPSPHFFILEKYRMLAAEGKSQDAEALALRKSLELAGAETTFFALALIDFQERARTGGGAKEKIEPLERYLSRFGDCQSENVWRVEMMLAQLYLDCEEGKAALKHAETAYQMAPEGARGEVGHSIEYIKSQLN